MSEINLTKELIKSSIFDISEFETPFEQGKFKVDDEGFYTKAYDFISDRNRGVCILHGMDKLLERYDMDILNPEHAVLAREFYEEIFKTVMSKVKVDDYSPVDMNYTHIVTLAVDGYNVNKSFSANEDIASTREFVTTKCIHFDSATPFVGNIYGPNINIQGGMPVICNTRQYCIDKEVDPKTLIENIPNNYNVAVKKDHYKEILESYSYGLPFDLSKDMIIIMLYNEVVGGMAHAGTPPLKKDENAPALRPITHMEYQMGTFDNLRKWFDYYSLDLDICTDQKGDRVNLTLDYHKQNIKTFDKVVKIDK